MLPMVLNFSDQVKVQGESQMKGYEKQIDVAYLEHAISMPMVEDKSSNSRTSGRCKHNDIVCTMRMNKAYPKLVETCAKGLNMGTAQLVMAKMSEGKISEVAKIEMSNVFVSSIELIPGHSELGRKLEDSRDNSLPWFTARLSYQSIAVTYNEYDASGSSKGAVSCEALTGLGT